MYYIPDDILLKMKKDLYVPERGGILGVNISNRLVISNFFYDSTGITRKSKYIPDIDTLNRIIKIWAEMNVEFIGFIHSHPYLAFELSLQDIVYSKRIKKVCMMPEILMMIYTPQDRNFYQYIV